MATSPQALGPLEIEALTEAAKGGFSTSNTDLAACLSALGVRILQFRRIREAKSSQVTTWYIFARYNHDETVESQEYEYHWRHRAEFESDPLRKDHPFTRMREGIDSLRWIVDLHYGRIEKFQHSPIEGEFFSTDDWHLAACMRAAGNKVSRMDGSAVSFFLTKDDPVIAVFQRESYDFEARRTPTQWCKYCFYARQRFIDISKPPKPGHKGMPVLRTQVRYVRGTLGQAGGKECLLYEDTPEHQKRELLTQFYAS